MYLGDIEPSQLPDNLNDKCGKTRQLATCMVQTDKDNLQCQKASHTGIKKAADHQGIHTSCVF